MLTRSDVDPRVIAPIQLGNAALVYNALSDECPGIPIQQPVPSSDYYSEGRLSSSGLHGGVDLFVKLQKNKINHDKLKLCYHHPK